MIVGPLKKGLNGGLPVIIVFFILVVLVSFFSVSTSSSIDSRNVLYFAVFSGVHAQWLIFFINSITLILAAVLLAYFTVKHEIVDKQNFIPPFLYLFFSSLTLGRDLVHPALIANIFIMLALNSLMDTYRTERALSQIFNAAFYTSLAIFFYLNYAFFIALFFITLVILRPFNWREWVTGCLGLLAPAFIYACIGYLANFNALAFFDDLGELVTYFRKPLLSEYFLPVLAAIIILLVLTVLKHLTSGLGSKIKTQKTLGLIYWFLALSVVNFFAKDNNFYFPVIASVIALSILFGDYFFNIRQLKIANTLFMLLLASGVFLFLMHLGLF